MNLPSVKSAVLRLFFFFRKSWESGSYDAYCPSQPMRSINFRSCLLPIQVYFPVPHNYTAKVIINEIVWFKVKRTLSFFFIWSLMFIIAILMSVTISITDHATVTVYLPKVQIVFYALRTFFC